MFGIGEPKLKVGDRVWVRGEGDKDDKYMIVDRIQYDAAMMKDDKPGAEWEGMEIRSDLIVRREDGWTYDGTLGGE